MCLVAVVAGFSTEFPIEIISVIDDKHGVDNVAALQTLGEKFSCERDRIRRKQPKVKYIVGFRIDCGVQPALCVVDQVRPSIDGNALRAYMTCRLYLGLLDPVPDRGFSWLDAKIINNRNNI